MSADYFRRPNSCMGVVLNQYSQKCENWLTYLKPSKLENNVSCKFPVSCSEMRMRGKNTSVKGRRVSRHQNPTSVTVWAAVTATRRSPLVFVPSGAKLNSRRYISDILEGERLPWAREHFERAPWTIQQDSAPSHGSRMTQRWIQTHITAFISKKEWPSRSQDLNPLDFSVWSILESKACRTSHDSLENLKAKLQREWALVFQEVLCVSCNAFQKRLKQIIKIKEAILNK